MTAYREGVGPSIGVNAAGVAGVATPQYLTCVDDPPIF